jgi:hypothetical protein
LKQYYHKGVKMPEPGEVRELVDRSGTLKALGVVYGIFPKQRVALLRELEIGDDGKIEIPSKQR